MANEPIVVIEGALELQRMFRTIGDVKLQKMLREANKKSAEVVVRKALPNVPVGETGNLKASLRATGGQALGEARAGGVKAPYANVIHWGKGTGNVNFKHGRYAKAKGKAVAGRPFLWDALEASQDEVVAVYTAEVNAVMASIRSRVV